MSVIIAVCLVAVFVACMYGWAWVWWKKGYQDGREGPP